MTAATPGGTRTLSFSLTKNGAPVVGIYVDIIFPIPVHGIPSTPIPGIGSYNAISFYPALCNLVPNINRRVRFTLFHDNCYYQDGLQEPISPCSAFKIRAYIYNESGQATLPNGALFTCDFRIESQTAPGSYPISAEGWAGIANGYPIQLDVLDGFVGVGFPPTPGSPGGGSC
jgi:hypothetical protein